MTTLTLVPPLPADLGPPPRRPDPDPATHAAWIIRSTLPQVRARHIPQDTPTGRRVAAAIRALEAQAPR